jgi:glutathione S-transferase
MLEKDIPFELRNEIPWHSTTETPQYILLEKLPILIFDDGRLPIYEPWHIQEYLVQKYKGTGRHSFPSRWTISFLPRRYKS